MQGSGTFESHQKAGLKGATLSKSLQKIGASRTYLFQSTQKVGVAHKAVEPVSIGMGMRTESSLLLDISLGVYKQFTYKLKNDAGIRRSSVEVLLLKNALSRASKNEVTIAVGTTNSLLESSILMAGIKNKLQQVAKQIVALSTTVDTLSHQQIGTRESWLSFSRECLGLERHTEPNVIAQFGRHKEDKVHSSLCMGISGYLFSEAYINLGLRRLCSFELDLKAIHLGEFLFKSSINVGVPIDLVANQASYIGRKSLSKYNIWIRATPLDLIDLQRKLIVRSSSKEVSAARTKELSPNIRQ